ncbi:hypothetical protein K9N68_05390 [Kovacikia minuta CCNUW1]|uniref:hypothetical protein n=1 Tax=Kovacikia minuta TaxID=2931930 RepID=UPI001CCFE039|nr:hypothetical protein [Kovacikia minuta]UBF27387.1 hypothetical protein K9N68_05390 [Kovacikia minuta CCNUW1]
MKSSYLTIALFAGISLLGGCSLIHSSLFAQSSQDSTAAQSQSASDALTAARQLAWDAAVIVQKPPHPVQTWQQAKLKLQQAIALLETASKDATLATQVSEKLSLYRTNYTAIDRRLTTEQTATNNLQKAQDIAWQASVAVQNPPHPLQVWQTVSHQWQDAIALLEKIPKTTSVFSKSREKLATYRNNYATINQRVETETNALVTLKQFSETAVQFNQWMTHRVTNSAPDSVGLSYQDYDRTVQQMEASLNQFASQPEIRKHLIYSELAETVEDHKLARKLWQAYLNFQQNTQGSGENPSAQLFPVSFQESNLLIRKYGVRTYGNGTQISLKHTLWSIWQHANQQIRQAQQKMLSLKQEG